MFNIEEKIKKWYENQKNVPIVKNDSKENEEVVTKGAIFVKLASQEGSAPGHTHDH